MSDRDIVLLAAQLGIKGASEALGLKYQSLKNRLSMIYDHLGARSLAHATYILLTR